MFRSYSILSLLLTTCALPWCTVAFVGPITRPRSHLVLWDASGSSRDDSDQKTPNISSSSPVSPSVATASTTVADGSSNSEMLQDLARQVTAESQELFKCLSIMSQALLQSSVTATDIVECCDTLDQLGAASAGESNSSDGNALTVTGELLDLRRRALEFQRYTFLSKLLKDDYEAYIATASFLSPSRIPRGELPNVQDVPLVKGGATNAAVTVGNDGVSLVADCDLEAMEYKDSPLDQLLLNIFRKLVTQHTNGVTSEKSGIEGLLEQGRTYMLQPGQTAEAQHKMVYNTLKSLMTPVLPPFYRIFMTGIVPKINSPWDGKQIGPWFYAPFLTSFVTPVFFAFLVGPSKPNLRKDGSLGGLVVEKCKFLQESGCKGLCLHQCKLPAQQFFDQELGLALTVSPNFVIQECQWSFGEEPLPPSQDPTFPDGCLSGCPSRETLAASVGKGEASKADLCNYNP